MTRSILSSFTLAWLLALAPPVGAAPAAADQARAKVHFERAETAYRLGRYPVAIKQYEAAYRLMPEPAFLFNIAQSYRHQYLIDKDKAQLQRALALYKTYLREARPAPNRKLVIKLIDELEGILSSLESEAAQAAAIGKLVVSVEGVAGAEVRLDGKLIGQAPLTHPCPPGSYYLVVSKPDYRPWSDHVRVSAGSVVRLPVSLEPLAPVPPSASSSVSRPIYKRWWFWTLVGAVVVAGTGTGIYLGTRGDGDPTVPVIDLRGPR